MITLDRVTFGYRNYPPVLRGVSLSVSRGESACIMGGNGCGKSTLACIIAGLTAPQSGSVRIDIHDQTADSCPSYTVRPVGILFQNPDNQMVAVTVEKEIAFALENAAVPLPEMETTISATLAQFGIEHLRNRLTAELSGGEKQRVALAAVMVCKPPIIVLDEPDSFLDERGKQLLNDALCQMHASNHDLIEIRITQYPHVARQYKRLIVMHGGEIAADGDPQTILNDDKLCVRAGLKFSDVGQNHAQRVILPFTSIWQSQKRFCPTGTLRLTGVSFGYAAGTPIIKHLNMEWKQGETIGLVGASGSGKSTIGSLLCGLLKPQFGKIELISGDNVPLSPAQRSGAVVGSFQQPERQFFLPTCAEEIAFGPMNLGVELSSGEIASYLAMVGLDPVHFAVRDPFSLSMGEKRRLAFAAILSMNPAFIVFDEPTCGLDPEGVGRFALLSHGLKEMKVGQLIISHDRDLIAELCDRVLLLSGDGQATESGIEDFSLSAPC